MFILSRATVFWYTLWERVAYYSLIIVHFSFIIIVILPRVIYEVFTATGVVIVVCPVREAALPPLRQEETHSRHRQEEEESGECATSPPPLLHFIEEHGDLFKEEVLDKRLCPHGRAMLARTGRACWAAVSASGLPRAGHRGSGGERLSVLAYFVSSVELFKWARLNGYYFETHKRETHTAMCCAAARSGHLETLQHIASLNDRLSDNELVDNKAGVKITAAAVEGGQLEVLNWLRRNHFAWSADTRRAAWTLGYELYD
jgi:hypothetical protein